MHLYRCLNLPCECSTNSGAYLPANSGPQSSSALIGLLCRPGLTTQPTRSPPGSEAEATSACPNSHKTLTGERKNTCANSRHSGSADGQNTSRLNTTAAPSWQECPLCQQPVPIHDLKRHINAELDGIMSAGTSSQPADGTSCSLQASARLAHLHEVAVIEQGTGEAKPVGSRSSSLPHTSAERRNSTTGRGLPPKTQGLGSCSNRGAPKTQQHDSQQAQRHADRGVPDRSGPSTGRPFGHMSTNILGRQSGTAAHDSTLRQGHSGMVEACKLQSSREATGRTGATSGAAQSGPAQDALKGSKRRNSRPKPPLPPAKVRLCVVLILVLSNLALLFEFARVKTSWGQD